MAEAKALAHAFEQSDKSFFLAHPDRLTRIRLPYEGECYGEFWSLGPHENNRRRIILCRADHEGKCLPDDKILKIPFLAFADEEISNRDDILLPIVREIMAVAFQKEKVR